NRASARGRHCASGGERTRGLPGFCRSPNSPGRSRGGAQSARRPRIHGAAEERHRVWHLERSRLQKTREPACQGSNSHEKEEPSTGENGERIVVTRTRQIPRPNPGESQPFEATMRWTLTQVADAVAGERGHALDPLARVAGVSI